MRPRGTNDRLQDRTRHPRSTVRTRRNLPNRHVRIRPANRNRYHQPRTRHRFPANRLKPTPRRARVVVTDTGTAEPTEHAAANAVGPSGSPSLRPKMVRSPPQQRSTNPALVKPEPPSDQSAQPASDGPAARHGQRSPDKPYSQGPGTEPGNDAQPHQHGHLRTPRSTERHDPPARPGPCKQAQASWCRAAPRLRTQLRLQAPRNHPRQLHLAPPVPPLPLLRITRHKRLPVHLRHETRLCLRITPRPLQKTPRSTTRRILPRHLGITQMIHHPTDVARVVVADNQRLPHRRCR